MKVFEKENPSAVEWMERISLKKKKKKTNFSAQVGLRCNIRISLIMYLILSRKGREQMKDVSPLNWLSRFPTRRVYDYGFRVFSFLCFIKDGIYTHGSPSVLSLIFHSGARRESIR